MLPTDTDTTDMFQNKLLKQKTVNKHCSELSKTSFFRLFLSSYDLLIIIVLLLSSANPNRSPTATPFHCMFLYDCWASQTSVWECCVRESALHCLAHSSACFFMLTIGVRLFYKETDTISKNKINFSISEYFIICALYRRFQNYQILNGLLLIFQKQHESFCNHRFFVVCAV